MDFYEIIIESMNPCGGQAHSNIEIVEAELESPMDYVNRETGGGDFFTESVNSDGSVVIESSKFGYLKRYIFTKA